MGADTWAWLPPTGVGIWLVVVFAWLLVVTDRS